MADAGTAPAAAPVLKAASAQTSTGLTRAQNLELHYWMRLTRSLDVPVPYSPPLEDYVLPQTGDILRAVRHLAAH